MDEDRFKGATKQAIGKVESGVGHAAGSSRVQADGMVDQASGIAQNAIDQVKGAANDVAGSAKNFAKSAANQASDYVGDGNTAVTDYIGENPLAAVAMAAAAGYLVAYLLHRS